jgi:hypothetical protein
MGLDLDTLVSPGIFLEGGVGVTELNDLLEISG